MDSILEKAATIHLQSRFRMLRRQIAAGVLIGAGGIILFAWATNPSTPDQPAAIKVPMTTVEVVFENTGSSSPNIKGFSRFARDFWLIEEYMVRRIDYYDDPDAPPANSLVPSVNVVVTNDRDEILLIRRSDNDNWALPGGAIDLGESLTQAAIRETKEETGIDCEITGLVGIYTDPKHVILYTSNNEVRQEFSIVVIATATGGQPTPSTESSDVRWVTEADATSLRMDRSMRQRIDHYLARSPHPHLD